MKRNKFIIALLSIIIISLITGCTEKRVDLKFEGEKGTVIFNVKDKSGYRISTDKKEFKTSKEQAVLIGNGFKIGIEFNSDFAYFYNGDFDKLKEDKKESPDFKEVSYGGFKGIQYFYGSYNRYNIMIPCKDSQEYMLNLYVYGPEDKESSAKTAIKNEEVLDILNNIKVVKNN